MIVSLWVDDFDKEIKARVMSTFSTFRYEHVGLVSITLPGKFEKKIS